MNENARRSRTVHQIANELCDLYQQQVDTLQQGTLAGLAEGGLKKVLRKKATSP